MAKEFPLQVVPIRNKPKNYKFTSTGVFLAALSLWLLLYWISSFSALTRNPSQLLLKYVSPLTLRLPIPSTPPLTNHSTSVLSKTLSAVPFAPSASPSATTNASLQPSDKILQLLLSHPLHQSSFHNLSIEELLFQMHQRSECLGLPIFITMAKIASPIYAQLVENFQFTMLRYDLLRCSLLVCLNDLSCSQFCRQSSFPCYDYTQPQEVLTPPIPSLCSPLLIATPLLLQSLSTFEQIAKLKLFDIPLAISRGVSLPPLPCLR
jgi:hypothetical protein